MTCLIVSMDCCGPCRLREGTKASFDRGSCLHAGKRQDNRAELRPGSLDRRGFRFFADDEDEFGLEDMLQALCFRAAGRTWVPVKPWEQGVAGKWVRDAQHLSPAAQQHLQQLAKQ